MCCWENRQVSLLKYKEQIFQIALELHKYNSHRLFLSSRQPTASLEPQPAPGFLPVTTICVRSTFMQCSCHVRRFPFPQLQLKRTSCQNKPAFAASATLKVNINQRRMELRGKVLWGRTKMTDILELRRHDFALGSSAAQTLGSDATVRDVTWRSFKLDENNLCEIWVLLPLLMWPLESRSPRYTSSYRAL